MRKFVALAVLAVFLFGCSKQQEQTTPNARTKEVEDIFTQAIPDARSKIEDISAIEMAHAAHISRYDIMSEFMKMEINHVLGKTYQLRVVLKKVQNNPELRKAFLLAKKKEVTICVSDFFDVEPDWVYIDYRASDQQLLDFLL